MKFKSDQERLLEFLAKHLTADQYKKAEKLLRDTLNEEASLCLSDY